MHLQNDSALLSPYLKTLTLSSFEAKKTFMMGSNTTEEVCLLLAIVALSLVYLVVLALENFGRSTVSYLLLSKSVSFVDWLVD